MKITRKTNLTQRILNAGIAFVLTLSTTSSALPYIVAQTAHALAGDAVVINNSTELRSAIENQADNQTWTINPGVYSVERNNTISAGGQTGWYMPITANGITITGVGNPTIYGTGYTTNGNWSTQDLVAVFGNNVTIDGLTLMPKVEPNKTIEVLGNDFTLRNTVITPNTLTDQSEYDNIPNAQDALDERNWGGSLYFNHVGNHVVQNVTINNAGISYRYSPAGTHIAFTNVKIINTTNVDWINGYRYSSGFNGADSYATGTPQVTYHVNSTLNNFESVLAAAQSGDVIELDSDYTTTKQLTVKTGVTINGNGHTVTGNFVKTGDDNNSVLGVWSDSVTVNNLTVDAVSGAKMNHGINVFDAQNVALNDVTTKNGRSGINVNRSTVTVSNVTTAGNAWHGIDVDKPGSVLTINGVSHHSDVVPVYIDDTTVGQVIDTNSQYGSKDNVLQAGDRVYSLKPGVPTLLSPANNGYTTTNDFYFDWTNVSGAVEYEFQSSQNPATTGGVLTTGVWNNKANGGPDRNHLTDSKIHSYGASGTWYWQVRAIDANGVAGDWSSVWKMTIDTAAPAAPTNLSWKTSANVTVANNGSTNIADGTAQWQASASSDVDHYIYKYWNDITGNQYKVGSEYVATTGATSLPGVFNQGEGVHHFCVAAVDRAGNTSACTSFTITYNETAPSISKIRINGTTIAGQYKHDANCSPIDELFDVSGDLSLTAVIDDANGVTKASYKVRSMDDNGCTHTEIYSSNSIALTKSNKNASNWNQGTAFDTEELENGKYAVVLVTEDAAGNKTTKYIHLNVENAAPTNGGEDNGETNNGGNTGGNTGGQTTTTPGTQGSESAGGVQPQALLALQQPGFTASQAIANADVLGVTDNQNSDTPKVKGASDQSKTLASTANPDGILGASDSKFFGLVWYWWLLIAAAALAAGWWIIAAARRRRDGDDA